MGNNEGRELKNVTLNEEQMKLNSIDEKKNRYKLTGIGVIRKITVANVTAGF